MTEQQELDTLYREMTPAPLRCRFHWHRWSVWSTTIERSETFYGLTRLIRFQKQECLGCGKRRERTVMAGR